MQIFIARGGQQTGPFSPDILQSMVSSGMVSAHDLAWHEDLPEWMPLNQVPDLPFRIETPPTPVQQSPYPPPVSSPYAPPLSSPHVYVSNLPNITSSEETGMFLHIPVHRLVILSILSVGIYDHYWIYRNWRYLNERYNLGISPFWRGVFGVFFIHSLLRRMKDDPAANAASPMKFSPGLLATGWLVGTIFGVIFSRIPDPAAALLGLIITSPTFCFLIPVQNAVNKLNEAGGVRKPYYGFSAGHVVCLILGLLIWFISFSTLGR